MANNQNLISLATRTTEEKREIGKKGGKASGEARRKKKSFRELISMISDLPVTDSKLSKQLEEMGIKKEDITYGLLVNFAQFQKAIKEKDTRSAEYIRDTLGEKPATNQIINHEIEDLKPLASLLTITEEEKKQYESND